MAAKGNVHYEKQGNIALLTVDNPPVNALSGGVRLGLWEGVNQALEDSEVQAFIVTGSGRAFIAGAGRRVVDRASIIDRVHGF